MRNITYQQLVQANACADQRALFKKLFGSSVVPTEALAREHGHLFNADFAASNFLSSSRLEQYVKARDKLWEQYVKARAPLWERYEKARDLLLEQYVKARDPLWEQYEKAYASLWEEYEKVCDLRWKQYRRDCMLEFVKLYQQGE